MHGPVEHRLSLPAGELCWFEWGAPSPARPSLLLVHATGFHARCWDGVVRSLPADMHIIAPDLRGHGRSFRPATLNNWAVIADDLLPLIDHLPPGPLVGVGHSMGGVCIVRTAAARADRFCALVLVDPVIFAPGYYAANQGVIAGDPADHFVSKRRNIWSSVDEMCARFATRAPYDQWDADVLADYCQWGMRPGPAGAGLELACPPLLEVSAYLGNAAFDPLAAAAMVQCPVTVLRARTAERTAQLDFSISPTWPGVAGIFPNGHDLQWPDCSHFIPMEQPARLAVWLAAMTC